MTEVVYNALRAINDRIGELEALLAEIRTAAAERAEAVSMIDDEIAEAISDGRTTELPALVLRHLKASDPLCQIGECLRHASDDLEKWRIEREQARREIFEPYSNLQVTEEEIAAGQKESPGRRAA